MRFKSKDTSAVRFSLKDEVAKFFLLLLFVLFILFSVGCSDNRSDERLSETRLLLDTYCTITVHGDVDNALLDEAFLLLTELEALFSITIEGSDVWRINNAGGEPVAVDPRTAELIEVGLKFSELSHGMFDITVGWLSRLWDFSGTPNVPAQSEIEEALATVDYRQVIVVGNTVQLVNPNAWIDLSAIAKGFMAYEIAEFLAANGAEGALVNLGGDIVAVGNRYDGSPWRVALRKPFGDEGEWLGVIEVSWACVLSSGVYQRQFEMDGGHYHHILDPNTGMPVISDVVSATMITHTAVIGEGFSTVAVLLGSERAKALMENIPGFVGAVLVLENGDVLTLGDVELK
ncbi:MAG: FAD:protein FMN transferase [Oscillospiraceae bacterium]|nr:FAD:protein FMN transferase [Oscillospiraceae bacterium]